VPRHINASGSPIPAAVTRMRTWPGPGCGGSSSTASSTSIGSPARRTCQARIRRYSRSGSGRSCGPSLFDEGGRAGKQQIDLGSEEFVDGFVGVAAEELRVATF